MTTEVFAVESGLEITGSTVTTQILNGTADPSVAPGVPAPISSCYIRAEQSTGNTFKITKFDKVGPADTDWQAVAEKNLLGDPSDGSWLDGLFQFTETTPVGAAVDQINEVLALLVPPPAPVLATLDSVLTGATGKLSFDTTHPIDGYSYNATAINTQVSKSGTCLGLFTGVNAVTGVLNSGKAADPNNAWPANSFGPGNEGQLELWVNGAQIHSVNLAAFISGATLTNGSGFNLSASTPVKFNNGNNFVALQYRTGTLNIAAMHQRPGYNFAEVKQFTSAGTVTTNQFFWFNATNQVAMSAVGTAVTFVPNTTRYLSGVKYYDSGNVTYATTVKNAYADCYSSSSSAVQFTCSSASLSAQALPVTDSNVADLVINAQAPINTSLRHIATAIGISASVAHPLKSTLSIGSVNSGTALIDNITTNGALAEEFTTEAYRVLSSAVPATATATAAAYDSTASIKTIGELQCHTGRLYYPALDFRSKADGGNIDYAPAGNPNYVGSTGLRTYVRAFKNTSGSVRANFKLNLAGLNTTFAAAGSLSGNNISVEMKFPQGALSAGTGWMDCYKDFATAQWGDGAGCRASNQGAGRALATDWGITVGTQSIAVNETVYVRVTAPASWAGYLESMTLTWL